VGGGFTASMTQLFTRISTDGSRPLEYKDT